MSTFEPNVLEINVGGLAVDVFSSSWQNTDRDNDNNQSSRSLITTSGLPVAVLILLHGRLATKDSSRPIVERALQYARNMMTQATNTANSSAMRELIVVSLDHRNHGARTVDAFANQGWHRKPEKHNARHAIDMYAIQTGAAHDVSFLIDFLPSYLFPNGERTIDTWAVAGVSLGGHSTWHCLKDDPRVTIGIPIIGCPDFLTLMTERARKFSDSTLKGADPTGPPTFPRSFIAHVAKTSPTPISSSSSATEPEGKETDRNPAQKYDPTHATDVVINPFVGKKILVLSGGADPLVPWTASQKFVDELQVGRSGRKEVFVQDGAGHECTNEMVERLAQFIWEHALCSPSTTNPGAEGNSGSGAENPKL